MNILKGYFEVIENILVEPISIAFVLGFINPQFNFIWNLNMMHKASLGHTRTMDVTTRPHSKKSRPEIQELAERKRGTQVEDDLLAPK